MVELELIGLFLPSEAYPTREKHRQDRDPAQCEEPQRGVYHGIGELGHKPLTRPSPGDIRLLAHEAAQQHHEGEKSNRAPQQGPL